MVDLFTNLSGIELKNPIIPASGTFGFGKEFARLYDLNVLGAISFKGTTKEPRIGNPQPRIAETPSGMLNAVGLQNPGIDAVIEEELPWLSRHFSGPIVANIGGFSIEEYVENVTKLSECPSVSILEVNISCPNLHLGGKNFGSSPDSAASVVRAIRPTTKKPLYIKLSPNVTDIASIAKACEDAGADGICLINTLLGMRLDLQRRRPLLANGTGGLSGPAIFPVAVRMVYQVYDAVKIPIIGCGGVASSFDAIEMMMAGASAVEVGAQNLTDPFASKKIALGLGDACEKLRIPSLRSIIGAAHNQ